MVISMVISPAPRLWGMLEAAVHNGSEQFGFQQEVLKAGPGQIHGADLGWAKMACGYEARWSRGRPQRHTHTIFLMCFPKSLNAPMGHAQTFDSQEHHPGKMSGENPQDSILYKSSLKHH